MDQSQLQNAQRSFQYLKEAIYQLESVFRQVCENMVDLQARLEKMEQRNRGCNERQD